MKTLVVASSFPFTKGVIDNPFLSYLYKNVVKKGVKVRVLAPHAPDNPKYQKKLGIEIVRYQYFIEEYQKLCYGILPNLQNNWLLVFQVPFMIIAQFFATIKQLREFKPDVIHAVWIVPQGFVLAILSYFINTKMIITAQGGDMMFLQKNNFFIDLFFKWIFSRFDKVTAVNEVFVEEINRVAPGKGYFIPNGTDHTMFNKELDFSQDETQTLYDKYDLDFSKKYITFVGRLAEKKGLYDFVDAVGEVSTKYDEVEGLIVGNGDMYDEIEKYINEKGLTDKINMIGWVDHSELPMLLKSVYISLYPSFTTNLGDREGLPNVYVESMASGCPVVTTRIDGIESVFENDHNAILVEQRDVESMIDSIEKLHTDDQLRGRITEQAYEDFQNRFRWDVIAQQYIDLYNE